MKKQGLFIGIAGVAGILLIIILSYTAWNRLDPEYTCMQCHEIRDSHAAWKSSAHASVACRECHGTALSHGFRGLKEKAGMMHSHWFDKKTNRDIYLNESQALAVAARCQSCHQTEYSGWRSGAHATTYEMIFMDEAHNRMEKPYADCFRCHGMFYDGDIHSLMNMESRDPADWHIKDKVQAGRPAITCLACHQMHGEQAVYPAYADLPASERDSLSVKMHRPATALYMRADRRHLASKHLQTVGMQMQDSVITQSADPNARLCMQCHAPDGVHAVASEDDKTPTGMYAGMSCMACHDPHSNRLKNEHRNVHKTASVNP